MSLRRTPFHAHHVAAGGRMIDFGGWDMPVQFVGIRAEHSSVRQSVGLFDVSHMGELRFRGPRALEAVRGLVTNDVDIVDGQAQYTAVCNERGGIVDDVIVYRIAQDDVLVCVNASNTEKDYEWMRAHHPCPEDVELTNESTQWAQLAIQGRHAQAVLQRLTDLALDQVVFYHFASGEVAGVSGCIVARTGYTGEDGFEVFLPPDGADAVWAGLLDAGSSFGIQPIGLGARDTLRL
ncbi:MAG: glycine cleavage system aminomethyltransferase GcvT, partial [Myxococcota bacterium]|nr:glycine cleavage system aminomethyltransferase GcvT [Myxococcota bacterium]